MDIWLMMDGTRSDDEPSLAIASGMQRRMDKAHTQTRRFPSWACHSVHHSKNKYTSSTGFPQQRCFLTLNTWEFEAISNSMSIRSPNET